MNHIETMAESRAMDMGVMVKLLEPAARVAEACGPTDKCSES
jgi:hypothetical protein